MFAVDTGRLASALEAGGTSTLSLQDLIDLYAQIILDQSDMADDETVQKILCKQTRMYCDFDPTIREGSQMIAGAKESTETIIAAVKENDHAALQEAFEKLQGYQIRIKELEKDLHTDELTSFFNRRYLFSQRLREGKYFLEDGVLFAVRVERFKEINSEHGYAIGDSVLKFFARSIASIVKPEHYEIIRFAGATFVILAQPHQAAVVERKIQGFAGILDKHTFKTAKDQIVKIALGYGKSPYARGESFEAILKKIPLN